MFVARVIVLSVTFYSCLCSAATITVDDSAGCSLRQAVLSANSDSAVGACSAGSGADTLQLTDRTTYEVSNSAISVSSDITIQGGVGAIVDKDATTGIAHRLFTVSGASASLSLIDLELYGDFTTSISDNGGCLHVGALANLSLDNVVVSLCLADLNGGGIYLADTATATIISSSVQLNVALADGGGIYALGDLDISAASNVSGNSADNGGGIFIDGANASLTLNGSSIFANKSTSTGGGIAVSGATSVELSNSTISGNDTGTKGSMSPDGDGAGIALINAEIAVSSSTVSDNSAVNNGGGFHLLASSVTIKNSIVAGNDAAASGQEFYLVGPSTFVAESTISATPQNLFGESSTAIAAAFDGYVPDSEIIVASSDGSTPTSLSAILDSAANHDTADGTGSEGSTYAHALVAGSPALSTADANACANIDQRAEPRDTTGLYFSIKASNGKSAVINLGGDCDLGAYESNL